MGLFILMGLPNATSVNPERDALFRSFKAAYYARSELVLTERLRDRGMQNVDRRRINLAGAVPVSMTFDDLATIVNGKENDEVELKAFENHFTEAKSDFAIMGKGWSGSFYSIVCVQ